MGRYIEVIAIYTVSSIGPQMLSIA